MTAGDLRITQTESGALVSWDVSAGQGSILLEGVNVSEMSRDDFMFTDVEGGDLLPEGREPIRADFFRLERNASERSEEHTSELQSLMRISYDVFCLKKKKIKNSRNQI